MHFYPLIRVLRSIFAFVVDMTKVQRLVGIKKKDERKINRKIIFLMRKLNLFVQLCFICVCE